MFQKVVNVYGVDRSLNSYFITNLPPRLAVKTKKVGHHLAKLRARV